MRQIQDAIRSLPEQLTVVPLVDEVVEAHGYPVLHPYIEEHWTSVLGPTSILLLRRLGAWASAGPLEVDSRSLAHCLGLGEGITKNAPLAKAAGRLVLFGAAEWQGQSYAVRRALGPVPLAAVRNRRAS